MRCALNSTGRLRGRTLLLPPNVPNRLSHNDLMFRESSFVHTPEDPSVEPCPPHGMGCRVFKTRNVLQDKIEETGGSVAAART